jgi:hypothetical protein
MSRLKPSSRAVVNPVVNPGANRPALCAVCCAAALRRAAAPRRAPVVPRQGPAGRAEAAGRQHHSPRLSDPASAARQGCRGGGRPAGRGRGGGGGGRGHRGGRGARAECRAAPRRGASGHARRGRGPPGRRQAARGSALPGTLHLRVVETAGCQRECVDVASKDAPNRTGSMIRLQRCDNMLAVNSAAGRAPRHGGLPVAASAPARACESKPCRSPPEGRSALRQCLRRGCATAQLCLP